MSKDSIELDSRDGSVEYLRGRLAYNSISVLQRLKHDDKTREGTGEEKGKETTMTAIEQTQLRAAEKRDKYIYGQRGKQERVSAANMH